MSAKRPPGFKRYWRILEYLRRNTDEEHPIAGWAAMREDCEKACSELLPYISCAKDTFKSTVAALAETLNSDECDHPLPPEQWRIIYDACLEADSEDDGKDNDAETRNGAPPVRNLYYRSPFSYSEVDSLIEGVLSSRTLGSEEANRLINKIEQNLTTKFYRKGPGSVCKLRDAPVMYDRRQLRENILVIQQAIDRGSKIAFRFNGYNKDKLLVPVRDKKDVVSPYYIVASVGRYYLLACQEKQRRSGPERHMSIWRIDLMSEPECLREKAPDKCKVEDLPQVWDNAFPHTHLNMSFDRPVPITLRITSPWPGGSAGIGQNYTFLTDWFGGSFHYERTETEPPFGDIVSVFCSPFGMVNFALQYSDRVEVLEPASVRGAVVRKIENLTQKYKADK